MALIDTVLQKGHSSLGDMIYSDMIYNPTALYSNGVDSIQVGGNNPSKGAWIVWPPVTSTRREAWDLVET